MTPPRPDRRPLRPTRLAGAALLAVGVLAGCGTAPAPTSAALASSPSPVPPPATSPATPTTPGPSGSSACVTTTFDRLTPAQRWAQLVVVGVPAGGVSPAARAAL